MKANRLLNAKMPGLRKTYKYSSDPFQNIFQDIIIPTLHASNSKRLQENWSHSQSVLDLRTFKESLQDYLIQPQIYHIVFLYVIQVSRENSNILLSPFAINFSHEDQKSQRKEVTFSWLDFSLLFFFFHIPDRSLTVGQWF